MKKLKNCLKKTIFIIGTITTVTITVAVLLFVVLKIRNSSEYNFSYNDGPYIFYLNDSTVKSVIAGEDADGECVFSEKNICLNDSAPVNKSAEFFPAGFIPSESFASPGEFEFFSERIAALSDIHGSYNHFKALLRANEIIDDSLSWIWGNGQLVIAGDVFDKGPHVTECLWLIKKLECQAEESGGKVHLLLGNHETYILKGNSEYCDVKYREICDRLFIDYDQLYGRDTYLGKWLRTKTAVVRINKNLFVHGGISDMIIDSRLSVDDINRTLHTWLNSDHLINSGSGFADTVKKITSFLGPLEYRGYYNANPFNRGQSSKYSNQLADSALAYYNAEHIIAGHTIVKEIKGLFDNRIIAVDTAFPEDDVIKKNSDCQMLIIENDNYYKADMNGKRELLFSGIGQSSDRHGSDYAAE